VHNISNKTAAATWQGHNIRVIYGCINCDMNVTRNRHYRRTMEKEEDMAYKDWSDVLFAD